MNGKIAFQKKNRCQKKSVSELTNPLSSNKTDINYCRNRYASPEFDEKMKDWNGKEIEALESRGGKISVCNYEDNLIIPPGVLWPHIDIIKKLYKSEHGRYFDEKISQKLSFYCDLQSLRSEDAITWSVFGVLNYFPEDDRVTFLNSILELTEHDIRVKHCMLQLWMRIVHPDTKVSGGPELDFIFITDKVVVLGESKWGSEVARNQGKNKNKTQIQLRSEFLRDYAKRIFPLIEESFVLLVGFEEEREKNCSFISWETVCKKSCHPLKDEIARYYDWKKGYR